MVAEEARKEKEARQAVFAKVESIKREDKNLAASPETKQTRGKRNADAMISYLLSMGNLNLVLFLFFAICSVGANIAGREFSSATLLDRTNDRRRQLCGSTSGNRRTSDTQIAMWATTPASTSCWLAQLNLHHIFVLVSGWAMKGSCTDGSRIMIVRIVAYSARLLHKRVLVAAMQYDFLPRLCLV